MSDDGIKLFVYGVNGSCPKDLLESEFSKSGKVTDIFNTGKGYAFVTMADERDAKIAVEDLNGQTIDGQEVKVEISHGKGSDKPSGGRGGGRDRGGGDRRGGFGGGGFGGGGRDRDRRGGGDRYGGRGRDSRYSLFFKINYLIYLQQFDI
jgi:cold-inducible RNA-binding protein